jgi:enoyl-CoA hydratase/carnithine racemase
MANLADMASGALHAESDSIRAATRDLSRDGANRGQQLAWCWHEMEVPVIAAVTGAAYGAGLHIALGADIRFVSPDARLAFVEVTWGLVPDMSGTQSMRHLIPLDVVKKMVFSGEVVDGRKAVALGLATELSEDPIEDALALAHVIAGRSPDAVRAAKRLLNRSVVVSLAEGLANEMSASGGLMGTPNQVESVLAKLQKRPAEFVDPEPWEPNEIGGKE